MTRFVTGLRGDESLAACERNTVVSGIRSPPGPFLPGNDRKSRGGGDRDETLHRIGVPVASVSAAGNAELSRGYTFLRRHKTGGLGQIWVVRDERAERDVALKQLRRDLQHDEYAQQLIRAEARITGQLQHPNIVPVYDLGVDRDGGFFYTMRFVHGRTLSETIDRYTNNRSTARLSRADLLRLLDIFRGVCNAVAYAHSKDVIHLDLKPSNVLVGEFGEVLLLDWGCARYADDVAGKSSALQATGDLPQGRIVGTPAYMAPEQIQGRSDDIRTTTDIYQLGAILCEILTGHAPHPDNSQTDVVRRVRGEVDDIDWAARAKRSNPAVPPALAAICGRALPSVPSERYQSVNQLRQDVENWMADEPVSVYRAGLASRSFRFVRRHEKLATVAIASLCLLLLFNAQLLRLTVQERSSKLARVLAQEMKVSVGAVDALESLFRIQGEVSRGEFEGFAGSYLERHRQLAALEWIPVVRHAERAFYEQSVRDSAWPSSEVAEHFTFTERTTNARLVASPRRELYYPVYYLAPYSGNEHAFGYDLGSSANRLETLKYAEQFDGVTISAPIDLVQSSLGFLAVSPVKRDSGSVGSRRLAGYVLAVFKADQVLERAWSGMADLEHFEINLYDVTDAHDVHLFWSNSAQRSGSARAEAIMSPGLWGTTRELSLWNREWLLVMRPRLTFVLLYPFSGFDDAHEPV